jgi:4-methylaminobutanoate oxidase (formaldehyde-forming)
LTDISSSYSAVGLMGPQSRNLLSAVSDFDFSKEDFPFMTSRDITVGYASVRATRITYVGELGWELYIPTEFTTHVYDRLIEAGTKFELKHAGYHAMDSLRVEKGYRSWGHDINNQVTPLEAGLGFAVDFRKDPPFIGREALLAQIQKPTNRRLMIFMLNNSEDLLLGEEPIYRDGILVGSITSGAYGHTLGCGVGMGYVNNVGNPIDPINASYEIEIAMKRVPAKASIQPPYDPRGLRVRM